MKRQKPLKLCDKAYNSGDIRNDGDRIGWHTKYNGKYFKRAVKSVMQFDTFSLRLCIPLSSRSVHVFYFHFDIVLLTKWKLVGVL